MKHAMKALVGIATALSLFATAPAGAAIIHVWTDPAGDILLDLDNDPLPGLTSYSFQHDITSEGFAIGDTILSAILSVTVRDVGGSETYRYDIGIGPAQTQAFSNVPNLRIDTIPLLALSLADLELDGIIDVVLHLTGESNNQPGLYFVSSRLEVALANDGGASAQVPEPGTALLVGLGLLGLGWRYRAREARVA